ncbi:MAG: FAD-dependent oxidoreductase [Terrimicrobiaceae bacterium]
MIHSDAANGRPLRSETFPVDFAVVGGGLAGTCAALTAARQGLRVALVQDRPVVGGNASSEVRLWVLGATCHMGSNNRWAREGGVIEEILVENTFRNPEGNPLLFDALLLEKVAEEKNITLLLNTAVFECAKDPADPDRIASVRGFCSQNSTLYTVEAPLFLDASGDGILGFLSGAAFRMGAESRDEFNEPFAPTGEFGALLGHSLYFYSKDAGHPVQFTAPSFALPHVEEKIPRYREFNTKTQGCRLWWIEWGGRFDTIHESERIKWELWRIVYGVWDYIKNSGKFPDAENLTLEWVGHIPGKRESRRFEGPYMLSQGDVVHRRLHDDAVAFGGWSIDLHPADGVFAKIDGSHHLHSKGPYQIPFRCYYSRNIRNLFLGGRIISATHVAFGSTRVMATGAHGGQAVGAAAALCRKWNCLPADISAEPAKIRELQWRLARTGQHFWGFAPEDASDLARTARITASSSFRLAGLPADGGLWSAEQHALAQILPLPAGRVPKITLALALDHEAEITFALRGTSRPDHHTPDVLLAEKTLRLAAGASIEAVLDFGVVLDEARIVFLCLPRHSGVAVRCSRGLVTGLMALHNYRNEETSAVGGEDFPIYAPRRRPADQNFALRIEPPVEVFGPANTINGVDRPTHQPNAWLADPADPAPRLTLSWPEPQTVRRIVLAFDTDFDHALESVLMGQPERTMPFCVKRYRILDGQGGIVHECAENHLSHNEVRFPEPVVTDALHIEVLEMQQPGVPQPVFGVHCYADSDCK